MKMFKKLKRVFDFLLMAELLTWIVILVVSGVVYLVSTIFS